MLPLLNVYQDVTRSVVATNRRVGKGGPDIRVMHRLDPPCPRKRGAVRVGTAGPVSCPIASSLAAFAHPTVLSARFLIVGRQPPNVAPLTRKEQAVGCTICEPEYRPLPATAGAARCAIREIGR